MKLPIVLLLGLLLTACSPVYVTAPAGGVLLPVEAGRIVDAATATAGAVATQVAQSTATDQSARATSTAARAATLESISDSQVLATLSAARTQDAIGATSAVAGTQAQATSASAGTLIAGRAQAVATAGAATSTAQLAQALATEAVHREQQRTLIESVGGGVTILLKLLLALGIVLGLGWLLGAIDADLTRRRNMAALRDTPIGPVIMIADPRGMLTARLLTAPAAPVAMAEPAPAPVLEHIQRTVNGQAAAPMIADWRLPELDAERQELAELIRTAMATQGEGGTRIPRYTKLPGWETRPERWKDLTDTLMKAGHVTKSSGKGGGTFLTKGRTLYQLLAGVLDGSLPLRAVEVVSAPNVSQNVT